MFAGENIGVAYFYCDYCDQQNQTISSIMASLLKQLASLRSPVPPSIMEFHEQFKRQKDSIQVIDLEAALLEISREFEQTYIVIDALDELEVGKQRLAFLDILKDLSKQGVKVFATSRPHPNDIRHILGSFPQISIEASDSDVRKYLIQTIEADIVVADIMNEPLQEEIVNVLTNNSQGMFVRLPAFSFDSLSDI